MDVPKHSKDSLSYVEFFKAKLCVDLLYLKDIPGKFEVYLIDEDTKRLNEKQLTFTLDNITTSIIKLFLEDYTVTCDTKTDFKDFYNNIISASGVDNSFNQNYFTKYVLYAYSDFVHDKKTKIGFQEEVHNIKYYQEELKTRCIIQNLYVIPHNIGDTENRKYILDDEIENSVYNNVIFANNYYPNFFDEYYTKYHKIKYLTHNIYTDREGTCSPNLLLPSNISYIRLSKPIIEDQQLHLIGENKSIYLQNNFQPISTRIVSIKLGTSIPSLKTNISLDISIDKGIHGIVRLEFIQSYPRFLKWLVPLICLISGLLLSFLICIKVINTK